MYNRNSQKLVEIMALMKASSAGKVFLMKEKEGLSENEKDVMKRETHFSCFFL